jgi:hypothetical protein
MLSNLFMIGPIASMFWDNEGMSDMMYLDGVICVVDGVFAFNVSLFHDSEAGCIYKWLAKSWDEKDHQALGSR